MNKLEASPAEEAIVISGHVILFSEFAVFWVLIAVFITASWFGWRRHNYLMLAWDFTLLCMAAYELALALEILPQDDVTWRVVLFRPALTSFCILVIIFLVNGHINLIIEDFLRHTPFKHRRPRMQVQTHEAPGFSIRQVTSWIRTRFKT